MASFTRLLKATRAAAKKYGKKEASAKKTLSDLHRKVQALTDKCKPHCREAVEKYNNTATLYIVPERLNFSFSAARDEINLEVFLRYPSGCEPDEEFTLEDVMRITSALRPLVDREFEKARIPLTLGSIIVPSSYYTK